ncbi:MAG: hypothetical protein IT329_14245 [Caldilineaceae bacterium]|nr:hypothetical protein [Caldilineaceae bacterium]
MRAGFAAPAAASRRSARLRWAWVAAACLLYLILAGYQLGLPGLHYDEAKEAGVNAVELLTGGPVTAFRDAAVPIGRLRLPLMVQDYIGALNVYLALPFLALTGIGVPNLRALSVLTGLAALLLMARAVSIWQGDPARQRGEPAWAAVAAVWLLAASPSFVFWSRQGIFVTNLMQPLVWWMIGQGLWWLQTGQRRSLALTGLAAGLALYAKLLAIWVVGPFGLLLAAAWWQRRRAGHAPRLDAAGLGLAALALVIPLLPLLIFNWQTGGVWTALAGNAGESYYGVDNLDLAHNAQVRLAQLGQSLRGDQFWYLGGQAANPLAPWLALAAIGLGVVTQPRRMLPALALLAAAFAASLFTISDLFVTHYALLQPLVIAVAAGGLGSWLAAGKSRRWLAGALIVLWLLFDLRATLLYHRALAASGGLSDHSDASYHLAYYLRYQGLGAPVALDWGIDATVRYLSENSVRPIEIFGYGSPAAPDAEFGARLAQFLPNPDNVYLLHAPQQTAFAGRREAFMASAQAAGLEARPLEVFTQRDGTPLFEVWRVSGQ